MKYDDCVSWHRPGDDDLTATNARRVRRVSLDTVQIGAAIALGIVIGVIALDFVQRHMEMIR